MRALPENLKKLGNAIGRCRSCKAFIWWIYRYGRPIPYDIKFEDDGTPYRHRPHRETCVYATDRQPRGRENLRDRADAHTEAIRRWKVAYVSEKALCHVDWERLVIDTVPRKHAVRLAAILAERGGPFRTRHPMDIVPHFEGVAIDGEHPVATLIRPAMFNTIHGHVHGFMLSVFTDMSERKPVGIAETRIEPSCVVGGGH